MFRDLQEVDGPFSGIAAHRIFGANLSAEGATMSGAGMLVSGSYFPLLGVRPAMGRLLGPEDDREIGAHPVAVLSHDFWQNELGGDPSVLNRPIVVNGQSLTIVGVAARGFTGTTMGATPDVFAPITMRAALESYFSDWDNRRAYWAYLFGRLKPGVDLEAATARINAPYSAIIDEVEATRRGPYAGAVGYADFAGDMDTCIALRTMVAMRNEPAAGGPGATSPPN